MGQVEPGSRSFFEVSYMSAGAKNLGYLARFSQMHRQGARSEMQQPGLELVPIRDVALSKGKFLSILSMMHSKTEIRNYIIYTYKEEWH